MNLGNEQSNILFILFEKGRMRLRIQINSSSCEVIGKEKKYNQIEVIKQNQKKTIYLMKSTISHQCSSKQPLNWSVAVV